MPHTPGPWVFYDIDATKNIEEPYHFISFSEESGWRDGEYMQVSGICSEANARLLAAAPKLLEALRLALPMMEEAQEALTGRDDICVVEGEDGMHIAIDEARAAIAKATGETP